MKFVRNWLQKRKSTTRTSRTVRANFSIVSILGVVALLGAAVVTSTTASHIRLETQNTVVKAGERFSLDVYAFAHVPVNAVDVTFQFDQKKVEVVSVDRGQSVLTIWTEDPIISNGKVILRGGTFRKGFLGEHKIASIVLRAKTEGPSEFSTTNVLLLAGDGKGTPVTVADSNASKLSLYVYDETTDPSKLNINVAVNILTDLDGDGNITLKDVSTFMGAWSNKSFLYDFNNDGKMSFGDFSIILASYFFGK